MKLKPLLPCGPLKQSALDFTLLLGLLCEIIYFIIVKANLYLDFLLFAVWDILTRIITANMFDNYYIVLKSFSRNNLQIYIAFCMNKLVGLERCACAPLTHSLTIFRIKSFTYIFSMQYNILFFSLFLYIFFLLAMITYQYIRLMSTFLHCSMTNNKHISSFTLFLIHSADIYWIAVWVTLWATKWINKVISSCLWSGGRQDDKQSLQVIITLSCK